MTIASPRLGDVLPTQLVAAREAVHHAAQLVALVGASYLEPQADDSHTSLTWVDAQTALAGLTIPAERPFRIALRLPDLSLAMLDDGSADVAQRLSLDGKRRDEALDWLRASIAKRGLDAQQLRSALHFSIATASTDTGAPFELPGGGTAEELARWYSGASSILEAERARRAGAGPVRCWPHHFDIATLVRLPAGGALQTIGIGLSPGDDSYAEPYYYVSPFPAPTTPLPPLDAGAWHTSGWSGAVLTGSAIVAQGSADAERALIRRFIDDAVERLRAGY